MIDAHCIGISYKSCFLSSFHLGLVGKGVCLLEYLKMAKIFSGMSSMIESYHEWKKVKYCVRCGAKFHNGTQLRCPQCGAKDPVQVQIRRRGWKELLERLLMIVLVLIVVIKFLQYRSVEEVRNSSPEAYPNLTLEEAYENFFDHPKWRFGEMEGSYVTVEFSGTCLYKGEEVTANLTIYNYVDSNSCTVMYLDFNGVPQDDEILHLLLNTIYGSYESK